MQGGSRRQRTGWHMQGVILVHAKQKHGRKVGHAKRGAQLGVRISIHPSSLGHATQHHRRFLERFLGYRTFFAPFRCRAGALAVAALGAGVPTVGGEQNKPEHLTFQDRPTKHIEVQVCDHPCAGSRGSYEQTQAHKRSVHRWRKVCAHVRESSPGVNAYSSAFLRDNYYGTSQ